MKLPLTLTRSRTIRATYGLVLLGFFVRVSQLNNVAIEKAEMLSIDWFIRPGLTAVLTQNKDLNNHPLNSLLAYFSSLGNESVFALRWHSVVIGVFSIALVIRLSREWFGNRDSLITGLLIAFSAYHITISQQARGYVGLVGFTLLGFYCAYQAIEQGKKGWWLGFIIAGILNIYMHLYGVMAVGVIGLISLGLLWQKHHFANPFRLEFLRALIPLAFSGLLVFGIGLALYLPMRSDTFETAGQVNRYRASDERNAAVAGPLEIVGGSIAETLQPFSLAHDSTRLLVTDPSFRYGPLDWLAALADDWPGFYFALFSFALGVIFTWRRNKQAVIICLAWLIIPFILQIVGYFILPGAYFRGRFLAFLYIPYFLMVARGWPGLADWLRQISRKQSQAIQTVSQSIAWLGLLILLILNLAWLFTFHTAARDEHWADVAGLVEQNMQEGDFVYCGQRSNTACSFDMTIRLHQEVKEMDDDFISAEQLRRNPAYFSPPGQVWMLMPHLTQAQIAPLKGAISPENLWLFGNPAYDQTGLIRFNSGPNRGDNLASALTLGAEIALNPAEKLINQLSLTQLHLANRQLTQAEATFANIEISPATEDWQKELQQQVAQALNFALQAEQALADIPPTAQRIDRNLGGLARLVAYETDRQTLAPGEALTVRLYWQALAPIEQNFISYTYLTDKDAVPLIKAEGVPGNGANPTPMWEAGQLIVDSYTLNLEANSPAPLALHLEAGLYEPETFRFVPHLDEQGKSIPAQIAKIAVLGPANGQSPSPEQALEANFGNQLKLLGYTYSPNPPGISLYWQAEQEIEANYTLFAHLLDENDALVGQIDGQPYGGNYPTAWWPPETTITDTRPFPALPAGSYKLVIGWYQAWDGQRLTLPDGSDSLNLGEFVVP